jgi:hypothetical protein
VGTVWNSSEISEVFHIPSISIDSGIGAVLSAQVGRVFSMVYNASCPKGDGRMGYTDNQITRQTHTGTICSREIARVTRVQ